MRAVGRHIAAVTALNVGQFPVSQDCREEENPGRF